MFNDVSQICMPLQYGIPREIIYKSEKCEIEYHDELRCTLCGLVHQDKLAMWNNKFSILGFLIGASLNCNYEVAQELDFLREIIGYKNG